MKTLLLSLAALLLLSTCTKPDPLPPVTEVGAQTFGCRIDGQPYVPDGGTGWNAVKPIRFGFIDLLGGRYLMIQTTARDGRTFFFFVKGATQVGRYKVDHDARPFTNDSYTPGYIQYIEPGAGFVTNPTHVGWVTLTRCDTAMGLAAGTFEFQAFNSISKQAVNITDGRFDLNTRKN
jgi:hypothetical protein